MWLSPEMSRSAMGPSLVWVARSLGGLRGRVKAVSEEVAHRRIPAELDGTLQGSPRFQPPPELLEQVPTEGPVRLVASHILRLDPAERREPELGATSLAKRGGVADAGADSGREPEQSLVQQR